MAELTRFERRILASSFIEFYQKALPGQRGTRMFFNPAKKTHAFLFLLLPYTPNSITYEKYREIRRCMLEDYCIINKLLNQEVEQIVGIGCKTRDLDQTLNSHFFSEGQDFLCIDLSNWNDTDAKEAQSIHDKYVENGLLAQRHAFTGKALEFPESS